MRRAICISEPNIALAGDQRTWRFAFVPSANLPSKTLFRFDPLTKGGDTDWQLPATGAKAKSNTIWLTLPNGKSLHAKEVVEEDGVKFDFIIPEEIKSGERVVISMGSPTAAGAGEGNRSQSHIQRRRPFHLYIDPKGKGDFKEPEVFSIDVRGNRLANIRIIAPSIVYKNNRFDVYIRFEDIYGNLTGNAPEGTLIELSYEHLRENLNWKLFIPETGFLTLPNLYFNEVGIYHLKLKNLQNGQEFVSAPIQCFLEAGDFMFWGLLHGESIRYTEKGEIETSLRSFRDDAALQFYATSPFEEEESASSNDWKNIANQVAEFNEEERFVSLLGFQWVGEPGEEGVRHMIYAKDNKPLIRRGELKSNTLKKIYKSHTPKELLSIPCFTMGKGYSFNFANFQPEFERVVEIYNCWGSSETSSKKGNPRPIKGSGKKGVNEVDEGSIQKALLMGCRFGFVAGGLDHRGVYANLVDGGQTEYSPGLTAILSPDYSRDSLFNALYRRRCYATTGERIILHFNIAKEPLGSELNTKTKPGLAFNRHIHGFVAGTAPIEEILIIRNGKEIHTISKQRDYVELAFDDSEPIEKVVVDGPGEAPPFVYYYLRVTQSDGHIAWSSPIWIDYIPDEKKKLKKGK